MNHEFIRCIAITQNNTQCRRFSYPSTNMFCKIHNKCIPKKIIFQNIFINNISLDDYLYLLEKCKNIEIINEIYVNTLLKDYYNQKEFNKRLKEKEIKDKEETKINNIKICKCCYTDEYYDINLMRCDKITSKNSHKVCIDCFNHYIDVQIKDNNANIICIFNGSDKCDGKYDINIIKCLLDENKFNKYYDLYLISEVKELAKSINNYQICPNCAKYGLEIDINNEQKIEIKCGRCEFTWCNLCRKKYHDEHCYLIKIDEIKKEEQNNIILNIINDIKSKKIIHKCPHCNTSFIKTEGCNMMTCEHCHGYSCYICGDKIFPKFNSKYYHFKGHALNDGNGTCPLYNNNILENIVAGNINYNFTQIIKEFDILLNVNKNINIKKQIYENIKKSYNKEKIPSEIINIGKKYKLEESLCIIL